MNHCVQVADSSATGGNPTATGGKPTADVRQGSHYGASLLAPAPDITPYLKKFTTFCYQIASGMVSVRINSFSFSPLPLVAPPSPLS